MRLRSGQLAAVLGVAPRPFGHPAVTPLELWEQITSGRPDRFAELRRVSRGLEPGVALMVPNADGLLVAKVALWHEPDEWAASGPPDWLFVAVQRRLAAEGATKATVACLLAGGILKIGRMAADESFQGDMFNAEAAFLSSLESGLPPAASDEIDRDVLARMFPTARLGESVNLPERAIAVWATLKALRKQIRKARQQADTLEASLRQAIGSASEGLLPDGRRLALRQWGKGRKLSELR